MRPSVDVERSRGVVGEGEKESEVMGVSCGRSTRVDKTKLHIRGCARTCQNTPLQQRASLGTHLAPSAFFFQILSCLTGANPSCSHESTVAIQ